MLANCQYCVGAKQSASNLIRHGFYFRTGDSRRIQRFRCKTCKGTCSNATGSRWFRHKKRRFHEALREHFASLGAVRRGGRKFKVNRKTIARKLVILGEEAEELLREQNTVEQVARVI